MSLGDTITVLTSTGQKLRGVVTFRNDQFIIINQGGGYVHVKWDAGLNRWTTGGISVTFEAA